MIRIPCRNGVATSLALLLLAASPGLGAAQLADQNQGRGSQRPDQMTQPTQRVLRGTIESVRDAQWRASSGQREQRSIVRLRMESGRTTYVDVGSKSRLQELNLSSGDRVALRGHFANVGGRNVFQADRIQVNGEIFSIQRGSGQRSQMAQGSSRTGQSAVRTVQGRVDGFRHVYLRPSQGERQEHSLVRIRLQDGRSLTVNLGPKKDLDDLGLKRGDRITIRGRQGTIDGRSVFFANQIRAGDQTIQIARGGGQQRGGQGQQASKQGEEFTVRGKVAGYQVLTLDSGEKQLSMLNLRLDDGRSILIDAGQNKEKLNLDQLDLRDRVVIKGHTKDVQGRQILVADNIQFNQPQSSGMGQSGQQQQSGTGSSGESGEQSGDNN